ncbi:GNAT family N-acetyltransferase [Candidatus Lokiarchaeum ossiferum]|uniref:GNAT family N-acetyltransferase n=1 Tax=Candidatus Lokiarchaeum ossiferum TaxID=2951803 RepID=UPI00352E8420
MKIINFSPDMYEEVYNIWVLTGLSLGSSDTKEQITNVYHRNPNTFLVGMLDKKIVAVVMGGSDARRGYVHHLAVHPDYQRKNYGKVIMDELIKRFISLDIKKIHLFIEKSNKGVESFYRKLGWILRDDLKMMSFVPER